MADLFYRTCLSRPVSIGGGAMAPITQLRDLYAHGYGRPHRKEEAEKLAASLHPHLGPADLSPEEHALGFKEAPYAFGRYSNYSPASGFRDDAFVPVVVELSPVAARRLLLLIGERVEAVLSAASWGLKDPLSEKTSKFVRIWVREQAEREAEQQTRQHLAAEKARKREAKHEEQAERRRSDHQSGLQR
ncbi:hypothetical protein [Curtobacterium sp. MCJR17_043]|nr:hypothetical protein [Curtobacterium sp. MCJR17_043]WIB36374.1 hypothetical protein DEJ15_04230 [Curtobacterium sp. MCJR17_043]